MTNSATTRRKASNPSHPSHAALPAGGAARADADGSATEPGRDCPRCPRLGEFREAARARAPGWFNAPVPSFGPDTAMLLIVGLAPGLQGANRTGRPFTGDYAGELLYGTLLGHGFADGTYQARPDDGLQLVDCRITNAVRCVPPQNKPLPVEIATCRTFLAATLADMPNLRAIVALGRVAHDSTVKALGLRAAEAPFGHGAEHSAGALKLFDSYHCSRYNTNTGVLTPAMFRKVFAEVRRYLDAAPVKP
ncbi:MAG: uracil-DNA glycosylase [Xanthobacteraceae bacterium]|nr:MAG: uracil-DNA glycosylase [Xanthobacteraceae bacterium]